MSHKDHYYNKAKQEDYRSRAAYKLKQIDREEDLLHEGKTVVDLGAAPGGWLQVAAEEVGEQGTVIGVDLQRIDAIDGVDTVRGDMTEEPTKDEVREVAGETVDVVLSDMAPNMTGEYSVDHARSVHLARQAFETALDVLDTGGDFAVKVFEGRDLDDLREDIDEEFQYVRTLRPDASRDSSSELYLVAKGRTTAPVSEGETLEVDIVDEGSEGDGVAKVDNYTLFVPGASEGETVEVEITEIKPRFGFAEVV
ncbi:23S rRNA (uridine(2552)-2'-O)-methyltransferase [Halorussus litoreus]|uniref:23S rRNA (uridine(2552)-2'-O)-methyltransferase n=1 Tax=Halorussus litoreus TaxID=1710536 RepID=UPI000E272572|nr:23S rRNA (uridine(2552)-2'-O)-methyltransferase [Halorussus litoreus]